jgi:hypothetical protein
MENYFFELPIYRCSEEKYLEEMEQLRRRINSEVPDVKGYEKETEETKIYLFHRQSYNYNYNEVIGWLKLYVFGNQIRGEYHFECDPNDKRRTKKRIDKGIRKKQFEYFGKAFESSFYKHESSEQIFETIIEEIEYLMKNETPFKGKVIDITKFEQIGKFVDWRRLLIELNPFNK